MSSLIENNLPSSIVEYWLDNTNIFSKLIEFVSPKNESLLYLFPPPLHLSSSDFPKQILCILRQIQKKDHWNFEQIINRSLVQFYSYYKKCTSGTEYNGKAPFWIVELEQQEEELTNDSQSFQFRRGRIRNSSLSLYIKSYSY